MLGHDSVAKVDVLIGSQDSWARELLAKAHGKRPVGYSTVSSLAYDKITIPSDHLTITDEALNTPTSPVYVDVKNAIARTPEGEVQSSSS
jgi:hypothetical protein